MKGGLHAVQVFNENDSMLIHIRWVRTHFWLIARSHLAWCHMEYIMDIEAKVSCKFASRETAAWKLSILFLARACGSPLTTKLPKVLHCREVPSLALSLLYRVYIVLQLTAIEYQTSVAAQRFIE